MIANYHIRRPWRVILNVKLKRHLIPWHSGGKWEGGSHAGVTGYVLALSGGSAQRFTVSALVTCKGLNVYDTLCLIGCGCLNGSWWIFIIFKNLLIFHHLTLLHSTSRNKRRSPAKDFSLTAQLFVPDATSRRQDNQAGKKEEKKIKSFDNLHQSSFLRVYQSDFTHSKGCKLPVKHFTLNEAKYFSFNRIVNIRKDLQIRVVECNSKNTLKNRLEEYLALDLWMVLFVPPQFKMSTDISPQVIYLLFCSLHTKFYVSDLLCYHKQPWKDPIVCCCFSSFVFLCKMSCCNHVAV